MKIKYLLIVILFAASCGKKEDLELKKYQGVIDSLNSEIQIREGKLQLISAELEKSDNRVEGLKKRIPTIKQIIKDEEIRIDTFIRNMDDVAKRSYLTRHLED